MSTGAVRAGTMCELIEPNGDWIFVDIGFSCRKKTCGYLLSSPDGTGGEARGTAVTYGELTLRLTTLVRQPDSPLHLVLEAPLSAAFGAEGNPVGRSGEKQGSRHRYWYEGLGCSVLVASLYLIRSVSEAGLAREARVFEGLVTFKDRSKPSSHVADVEALMALVRSGGTTDGEFIEPKPLDDQGDAMLESTLGLLGLDLTPPPIIKVYAI